MKLSMPATGLLSGLLFLAACGAGHRLSSYDFRNASLAVVYDFPPYPEVLTGPYVPGHYEDPVHAIIRAGSQIAKEIQAAQVRRRLDSAAARVNVSSLVADQTGRRAARYLGARLIEREADADFILEVRIRDYGIDADEWEAAANFFVSAEVLLVDGQDGRVIWQTRVRDRDPIAPAIFGGRSVARNVVTAAVLASLSVDDLVRALEQLADYSADHVTSRLRNALEESRR